MTLVALERCSAPPSGAAAQYETLRRAALGEPLPPQARSGLMLFLCRGMWGWTRTLAAASTRPQPMPPPSSASRAPCAQSAVVHLFAAMALHAKDRRAP